MTARHLCEAPRCALRGQHAPACNTDDCRGCLPRAAAPGSRLCERCTTRAGGDLDALPGLYADLGLVLATAGRPGERVSGGAGSTLTLNEPAVAVRTSVRSVLVSWAILVGEERGVALPADEIEAVAAFLRRHLDWLAAHPAAGDFADELGDLTATARRVAYPNGARTFVVGPCPRRRTDSGEMCEGEIRAILRRTDSLLPSELVCSADGTHRWDSTQWVRLGRELIGRAA